MPFRNQRQRSEVCRTLLAQVGLDDLWNHGGPDLAAQGRSPLETLPHQSAIMVLTAWALWDGSALAAVSDLLALRGRNLCAVAELLRALALDSREVDAWLERWAVQVPLSA